MSRISCSVVLDAVLVFGRGLSDHCPVTARFCVPARAAPVASSSPSVHDIICRSERFAELVDEHSDWAQLDKYCSATRWRVHKSVLKESARVTRNEAHLCGTGACALVGRAYALAHLARCLVHQNVTRMEALLQTCSDAQQFFIIERNRVCLTDANGFAAAYDKEWR